MSQLTRFKHIRFLGAAGIGMSALIQILEQKNLSAQDSARIQISKSDLSYLQNDPLNSDIDLVVRSTAIANQDPEFVELKSRGIPIWHRSDMLNYLSEGYKQVVVTGTHGKTTCTAMLSYILDENNRQPSFAVGGVLSNYNANGKFGQGEYFVLEGDESDKSFMKTNPYLALVTCVEPDHLENYPGGFKEIQECFFSFLDKAKHKIINIDDPSLKKYYESLSDKLNTLTYSVSDRFANFYIDTKSQKFTYKDQEYSFNLQMLGGHNFVNAVGCIAASTVIGVDIEDAIKALKTFKGIKRRFELINDNYQGSTKVFDDYAHHPSEIKALLEGILGQIKPKKMLFVYQPHHPERTQQFWDDFITVFKSFPQEHLALIADVYVARSKNIEGINSARMVKEIDLKNVLYLKPLINELTGQGNLADMKKALKPAIDKHLKGCDYLFIVGAGNIAKVAEAYR